MPPALLRRILRRIRHLLRRIRSRRLLGAPKLRPWLHFCSRPALGAGKEFDIPAAGGLGPFPQGSYLPYPRQYVAYKLEAGQQPPVVDGSLAEPAWQDVGFTEDFQVRH